MDSLDRRLIELQGALLKLATGQPVSTEIFEQAQRALSGVSAELNLGPGNDTVVINNGNNNNCECPTGPTGPSGPPGDTGPTGPSGPSGSCACPSSCILVSEDYQATNSDYYIGVNSEDPVTITLPEDCTDCQQLVIKAEMGPPLGNRKVTITTSDGSLIDGESSYVIEVPYQTVHILCRGGEWHII